MGIARPCFSPRIQLVVWGGGCVLAAVGSEHSWTVGAAALLGAGGSLLGRQTWRTLCLVIGAAPLWVGGFLGEQEFAWGWALLICAALLLASGRSAAPRPLPWIVLGVGLVQAVRMHLLGGALTPLAAPLAVGAVILAGQCAGVPSSRQGASCLAVAGVVSIVGPMRSLWTEPKTPADVQTIVAHGVERAHASWFADHPELGFQAVRLRPTWHELALQLGREHGLERVVQLGWDASRSPLTAEERLVLAAWLEGEGRGGDAVRVLWPGRQDARVRWLGALYLRIQGEEERARRLLADGEEIRDVGRLSWPGGREPPQLPQRISLDW
ncbi:MAG: hypothetical protein QGG40_09950, partial [Myxococcota bacterium]|nr:hypothetical protein [Myxococcota bacterium]